MARKVYRVRVDLAAEEVQVRGESKSARGQSYAIRGEAVNVAGLSPAAKKRAINDAVIAVINGTVQSTP